MNRWRRIRGMNKSAWRAFSEGRGSGWVAAPWAFSVQHEPMTIQSEEVEDHTNWTPRIKGMTVLFRSDNQNTGPIIPPWRRN